MKKILQGTVHKLTTEIKSALTADRTALDAWQRLTSLARNEWLCWILSQKKAETRQKHLKRLIADLKSGKKRPCCWIGCVHRDDKKISSSVRFLLKGE